MTDFRHDILGPNGLSTESETFTMKSSQFEGSDYSTATVTLSQTRPRGIMGRYWLVVLSDNDGGPIVEKINSSSGTSVTRTIPLYRGKAVIKCDTSAGSNFYPDSSGNATKLDSETCLITGDCEIGVV